MRYALLLRGINVGGKNKVVMADLKKDLAGLGFENPVSTLIVAIFSLIARSRRRGFERYCRLISVGLTIFLCLLSLSALPCLKKK